MRRCFLSQVKTNAVVFTFTLIIGSSPFLTLTAESGEVFTNDNLRKYQSSSSGTAENIHPQKEGVTTNSTSSDSDVSSQRADQSVWCSRGTYYRNRVDEAKTKVAQAAGELREADPSPQYMGPNPLIKSAYDRAQEKMQKARKELEVAENELRDFETEAHRNYVPAGWTRCQFE
jgi:hypothetical protein